MSRYIEILNLVNKFKKWLKGEALEQTKFVLWLEQNGYRYTHIPNSTWTQSIKQKIMLKMLGLNPGICDMLIILKRQSLVFIEMKKCRTVSKKGEYHALGTDGIKIEEEQIEWIYALNKIDNVSAFVCFGAKQAIEKIKELEDF